MYNIPMQNIDKENLLENFAKLPEYCLRNNFVEGRRTNSMIDNDEGQKLMISAYS